MNSSNVKIDNEVTGDRAKDNGKPQTGKVADQKAQNGDPQFDWITERSACSLPKVFSTLRSQIEQDVKTRNSLRPKNSPYEFSLAEDTVEITVRLEAEELHRAVIFSLAEHAISVRDDQGNRMFDVTLTFDDTGKCRLNVNGEERDFWQVRRMALEDLMFRGL
ncbi:MAG: hypothetical protein WB660_04325 [Candidatus Sulfotelmatobacter sp.]